MNLDLQDEKVVDLPGEIGFDSFLIIFKQAFQSVFEVSGAEYHQISIL